MVTHRRPLKRYLTLCSDNSPLYSLIDFAVSAPIAHLFVAKQSCMTGEKVSIEHQAHGAMALTSLWGVSSCLNDEQSDAWKKIAS